jgi:hypothetical protein
MGLYAGDLRVNFENAAGVLLGYSGILPTDRFTLNVPSELKQSLGKTREGYGQPVYAFPLVQPSTLGFTLLGNSKDAFRIQWLAAQAALSQASGTSAPAVYQLRPGLALKVPHRDISSVTVTSSPAGTSYALGTDFVVANPRLGIIEVVPGSDLADDVAAATAVDGVPTLPVLVGYTQGATAAGASRLIAGGQPALYAQLLFDGLELASNKNVDIFVPRVLLRADGDVDLLSSDPIQVQIAGQLIQVPGQPGPFIASYPQG